jgi:hypothetical protein
MPFEDNYEEDLVPRIRDLIDGYSKNSILKEYLQNADDSGATELIVTFDRREHSYLVGTKFQAASGPSLIIQNNSNFKQKDFEAIVKISAQGKVEDPNSTGRFGQGFSSSFSISDHPSFVSSGRAYWFDVLKIAVAKEKVKSIQGWYTKDDEEDISDWINTFQLNNEIEGTAFRLPLRTESTATLGGISHEVFSFEDFLEWCHEWKSRSSGLLFLRHIQKLTLQEINEKNECIVHVEIRTTNTDEIKAIGDKIQIEFSSSLLDICERWKKNNVKLPLFKYEHHFTIKFFDSAKNVSVEANESWAVVNGLFRGRNDVLIEQAIKVLNISPNPRKVLPWAGVAVPINEKGAVKKLDKPDFYSFLHLPLKSKHAVHIHGWFDLNPKRTEITADGKGNDKEILIEWNRLLFSEAIGPAWALLIDFIKNTCPLSSYYSLWPKNNGDGFDDVLVDGFFQSAMNLECIRTKHKAGDFWNKPSDEIHYLPNASKDLLLAIQEHFSIIAPKPTLRVLDGFEAINHSLREVTPESIREFLVEATQNIDLPIPIDEIPISMLSRVDWLKEIITFCAEAESDQDYSYLKKLPLSLTLNSNLDFVSEKKLVDAKPNLSVFQNDQSLFIHRELVDIVKYAVKLPSAWLIPSLENYLALLNEHLESYDRSDKSWIEHVIKLICSADEGEIVSLSEEISELEIVRLSNGEFTHLRVDRESPFYLQRSEFDNIHYLKNAGMEVIHPNYMALYSPLTKLEGCNFIKELNSHTLSNYLIYLPVDEYEFFQNKEIREYLTDILVQDISWIDELGEDEKEYLNDIPFLSSESGEIYAKNSEVKLYLSAGFKPPKHIHNLKGEFEIISTLDEKHHQMYLKMGFEEQNPLNYLKQVILPFIENEPSVDDVIRISEWLASSWDELVNELNEVEERELISSLSTANFVIDSDRNLNQVGNYYHPTFFANLPTAMQDASYAPYTFKDQSTQNNWMELLTILGASYSIIPAHIISLADSIIKEQNVEKSIQLINYISNHFELFENMKIERKNIFSFFSAMPWIPAQRTSDIVLFPEEEFKKLQKPSQLILNSDYKRAGGVHFCISSKIKLGKKDEDAEISVFDMAKKIGLLVTLPNESIFNSFRRLIHISSSKRSPDERVADYAKAFYKYLGRSAIFPTQIPVDLKEKGVLIKNNWLSASKVFQRPIQLSGIYSWDELIANDGIDSKLAEGLKKLGVEEKPDVAYLVNFLRDLPQNQKLSSQNLKDAKAILSELQNSLGDFNHTNIPLLSRSDKLLDATQLYIKDLDSYDSSTRKNEEVEFCQRQFKNLAEECGVLSLASNIHAKLDVQNSIESSDSIGLLGDAIRSDVFKTAILRLMYHEGKIEEENMSHEVIDSLLPKNLYLMECLVVNYSVEGKWIYDDLTAVTFKDIDDSTLYLLNQDDKEDIYESIAAFISDTSALGRDSFSIIGRILRNSLFSVEEIKYLLDQKNIKSLPEEMIFDDEISLYGDGSDNAIEEHFEFDDATNESIETEMIEELHKPNSVGDEIPPPTKPKPNNFKNGKNNHSEENKGSSRTNGISFNSEPHQRNGSSNPNSKSDIKRNKTSSEIVSPNDRKPLYVGREKEIDTKQAQDKKTIATEIGNKGENYILKHASDYIIENSHRLEKAPVNNKGYDIQELNAKGAVVRYIEVKTLTGVWGEGGVAVTNSQLEFAQAHDNWWLFVVENINTLKPNVYLFENPVQEANRFMFDYSWKQLSKADTKVYEKIPQLGDKYKLQDGVYEICKVDKMGTFHKVILQELNTGEQIKKKYDPAWETF